jgi:chromosome partitioning protein
MAAIITIANQKGGVGKTTLTALLGNYFAITTKYKVAIIDTDPQASLYNHILSMINNGLKIDFACFKDNIKKAVNDLEKQSKEYSVYDIVLVDTLPTTDITIVNLFSISNIVLIPVGSTSLDVMSSLETVSVVKRLNIPYKIVFNNIKSPKELEKIKTTLKDVDKDINMTTSFLSNRVSYGKYFANKLKLNDTKAEEELDRIIKELI